MSIEKTHFVVSNNTVTALYEVLLNNDYPLHQPKYMPGINQTLQIQEESLLLSLYLML